MKIIFCTLIIIWIFNINNYSFSGYDESCPNIFLDSFYNLNAEIKSKTVLEIKKTIKNFYNKKNFSVYKYNEFEKNIDISLDSTSNSDFYWNISVSISKINNRHTFFIPNGNKNNFGIKFQNLNGKNIVTQVNPNLSKKIHIGDEIISINSKTCLLGNLSYLNSVYGDFIFKQPDGKIYSENLKSEFSIVPDKSIMTISEKYAYIKISEFTDREFENTFYSQISKLDKKKIIIFDLQGNLGGTIREVISIGKYFFGGEIGYFDGSILGEKEIKIEKNNKLDDKIGKVFVIVDPESFSAAEIFAHLFRTRVNAQIIGQPTRGGLESALGVTMPDKSILSVANGEYCDRGVCFYGKRIEPDILLPLGTPVQEIISVILRQP